MHTIITAKTAAEKTRYINLCLQEVVAAAAAVVYPELFAVVVLVTAAKELKCYVLIKC